MPSKGSLATRSRRFAVLPPPPASFRARLFPVAGVKSLCRISVSDALALAVTEEGWYYVYEVDMETGSVRLLAQNNILEAETAGSSASTTSTATVPATATATAAEATAGGENGDDGDDDNDHGGGA